MVRVRLYECPEFLKNTLAIAQLMSKDQDEQLLRPRDYLCASHEVFALTLMVTWAITFFLYPHQIHEHPARPIIGSYNPCFGWDYAPASYIALVACSANVYFTWRYSLLENIRTLLVMKKSGAEKMSWSESFAWGTSSFFKYTSNLWLLLWLIGPNADKPRDNEGPTMMNWIIHTGIFVTYASGCYLASLGNYVEVANGPFKANVTTMHTVFIIVYGVVLSYLLIVYFYDLFEYEHGEDPALHPYLTQMADILWIGCIMGSNSGIPPEPPLRMTITIDSGAWDEEVAKLTEAQAGKV